MSKNFGDYEVHKTLKIYFRIILCAIKLGGRYYNIIYH